MHLKATIANALWSASNLPSYMRFRRALTKPQATQRRKLRAYLNHNARTAFGKAHRFDRIHGYEEFVKQVPLSDYDAFEPWIDRIRRGEKNVLTRDPVTRLVPTSGSTGARKLIPFSAGLQGEFNAAICAWLLDLLRQFPGVIGGPAYWSVTPVMRGTKAERSAVPIGFDADTAYLGDTRKRLVDLTMAVPSEVQKAESLESFRYQTLLHLLRCRDLRFISVWHPSFLGLLLDTLPEYWERLKKALPERSLELRRANPYEPESLWPELRVISCWGDGVAALAALDLRRRFPTVLLQPKGLLATEAFVTLPFATGYPLAVESHFFEFIDGGGRVLPVEALHAGDEYEVVVTTGGGLYRYRLGDRVAVTAWVEGTPSLRFINRIGNVSDRCGEKLSEAFVAQALNELFGSDSPRFALLAPDEDICGCRYTLYVEGQWRADWLETLDRVLRRNPHYACCRDLGQLSPIRLFAITERGYETFARRQAAGGSRLGDVKPTALSRMSGWSEEFEGAYLEQQVTISTVQ